MPLKIKAAQDRNRRQWGSEIDENEMEKKNNKNNK